MTDASARQPILDVRGLSVSFQTQDGRVEAVKKLDFDVARGECLGLVGESGSGKSQTVLAAMGLTAANGIVEGSIKFDGVEMTGLDRKQLNDIRGAKVAMIDFDRERLDRVAGEIRDDGGIVLPIFADVCEEDTVRAFFKQVNDAFGSVDVIVNSAGRDSLAPPVTQVTL